MDHLIRAGVGAFFFLGFLVTMAIALAILVLFILMLRTTLLRCAPQNRVATPDSAWFLIIPLFNLVWQFIFFPQVAESLRKEFEQRGLPFDVSLVKNIGLALAVLSVCCLIPGLNLFASLPSLICLALFWIKVSSYSSQIAFPAPVAAPPVV